MAGLANALALDGDRMTAPAPANAAIWYAPDGYDPKSKGINGRRVAGESFLRGFLAHGQVEEFVSLTHGPTDHEHFAAFAAREGVTRPLRNVRLETPAGIAPVQVVSYPSPNFASECWRRAPWGHDAHAICGTTHTTATKAVMQGMFDLRAAPQMPWDAVICTSQSVLSSITAQMDQTDAFLKQRFGGAVPPRPLLPVIPLGVTCADFARDPAAGAALRARLGLAEGDIACAIIARLTPHEKFDPLPLYLALARAQKQAGRRFHLLLCGQFRDDYSRKVFAEGARGMMPEVGFHLLDGADAAERKATLSGADIFLFPIDNVQETFGLAPIEAMAAGLPLIVSDWDGMKDTVPREVGLRVMTEMPAPDLTAYLGARHFGGTDSYVQYASQLSSLTRIDVRALTAALVALGSNPDLRAQMGRAGAERARTHYDWAAVIPRMQALWADPAAMLASARAAGRVPPRLHPMALPPAPAPGLFFRGYPTHMGSAPERRFRSRPRADRPDLATTLALRDYEGVKRIFEPRSAVQAVLTALEAAGAAGATAEALARDTGLSPRTVLRCLYWMMKYDFAE
jgi:glycosyltransferase involved in cell wall biosynthesis